MNNHPQLKIFRRKLRKNLTPSEAKLWILLKGKKLDGRRFRRQHSVGPYILDFYCPAEKLAIELNGQVHTTQAAMEYDQERDIFLSQFGILVLRIENRHIFGNPTVVLRHIKEHFGWFKKLTPPPFGSPSP